MRNCPNCGHEFDDQNLSSPNCPSCGREFTVSDIGAATIDFGTVEVPEMPPRSAPTVMEKGGKSLIPPVGSAAGSLVDGNSRTLQSGQWSPSAEELADAASSPDVLKTI